MILKLNKKIQGIKDEDLLFTEEPQVQNIMGQLVSLFREKYPENFSEFVDLIDERMPVRATKTVGDILTMSLMTGKQGATKEEKLSDYKLLNKIAKEEEIELSAIECEKLFNRVAETYNNTIIIGRLHDALMKWDTNGASRAKEEVSELLTKSADS